MEQVTPSSDDIIISHEKFQKSNFTIDSSEVAKTIKPKPIMVFGINRDELRAIIKLCEEADEVNFTVQMVPGHYVKILPETHYDKFLLSKHLENSFLRHSRYPEATQSSHRQIGFRRKGNPWLPY